MVDSQLRNVFAVTYTNIFYLFHNKLDDFGCIMLLWCAVNYSLAYNLILHDILYKQTIVCNLLQLRCLSTRIWQRALFWLGNINLGITHASVRGVCGCCIRKAQFELMHRLLK